MKTQSLLLDVQEASRIILEAAEDFGTENVPLKQSLGRILREDIHADRDFPPFDRVSMDGIAIKIRSFEKGMRQFDIEGVQAAGSPQMTLEGEDSCMEVMTGAILPQNTDAVIPYELIEITGNKATINLEELKFFQNVHKRGLDRNERDLLLSQRTRIGPAEIGVLATVGKASVCVSKNPRAAIISTGDELVGVDSIPLPHQIRRSNVHNLYAVLKQMHIESTLFHLSDDKEILQERIAQILEDFDVLLFSGAVSKGKFDFLPEVLENLGVEKKFHRVKQRPGKPFWFGKKDKKTIFAFPGNPVSTFVSCLKYFKPWLERSININSQEQQLAVLAEDFTFAPDLHYFLQVKIINEQGRLIAYPESGNGSGDLANLAKNNAFLELPSDRSEFKSGEVFPVISFNQ